MHAGCVIEDYSDPSRSSSNYLMLRVLAAGYALVSQAEFTASDLPRH